MKHPERTVYRIKLDDIIVDEGPRPLNEKAVARLARSMGEIGMHTPIVVVFGGYAEGNDDRRLMKVVTGRHRIAAARSLGWTEIEAIRFDDAPNIEPLPEDTDVGALAEMWAIAENLHRLDLSKEERDRQIRRYAELLEAVGASEGGAEKPENQVAQNDPPEVGYRKPPPQAKGIARRIADETGLSKSTVQRALNPDADRQRKEAARKRRQEELAEFDRQREEARAALPEAIKRQEEAKKAAIASRKASDTDPPDDELQRLRDRVAELEEAVKVLEEENATLKAENKKFGEMKAEYEKGGFEEVIAGRDEVIRAQGTRIETESHDKASWKKSADYWKREALRLGYSSDTVIDIETGEVVDG